MGVCQTLGDLELGFHLRVCDKEIGNLSSVLYMLVLHVWGLELGFHPYMLSCYTMGIC